jgi:hypothetical protein
MLILPKSHLVSKISICFLSKLLKIKVQQNFAFVKRSKMKEDTEISRATKTQNLLYRAIVSKKFQD